MEQDELKIRRINNGIILEKEGKAISISIALDDDIWFNTKSNNAAITLKLGSRNDIEYQTYLIFESLMKSIIGTYFLHDDNNEFSMLPSDFIDLNNKTIILHSDHDLDNVLSLKYDSHTIVFVLYNNKSAEDFISAELRASGSEYHTYYKDFNNFIRELSILESKINKENTLVQPKNNFDKPKRISFFRKI